MKGLNETLHGKMFSIADPDINRRSVGTKYENSDANTNPIGIANKA